MQYCAGDFGRTPRVNTSAGRDHWARSMAVLLAGGGFPGGDVYGSTDDRGATSACDACSPETWSPRGSGGWDSAPGAKSALSVVDQSRSSERGVSRTPGGLA